MSFIFDHQQQIDTTPAHNFDQDVEVQGVKLKRFRMAPDTFTSSRADAKVCCVLVCWCPMWLV